jgi:hypothetical protein
MRAIVAGLASDGEIGWSIGCLNGMIPVHGATATARTNTQQQFYSAAGLRRAR